MKVDFTPVVAVREGKGNWEPGAGAPEHGSMFQGSLLGDNVSVGKSGYCEMKGKW